MVRACSGCRGFSYIPSFFFPLYFSPLFFPSFFPPPGPLLPDCMILGEGGFDIDIGYWTLGTGYWVLDIGYWTGSFPFFFSAFIFTLFFLTRYRPLFLGLTFVLIIFFDLSTVTAKCVSGRREIDT